MAREGREDRHCEHHHHQADHDQVRHRHREEMPVHGVSRMVEVEDRGGNTYLANRSLCGDTTRCRAIAAVISKRLAISWFAAHQPAKRRRNQIDLSLVMPTRTTAASYCRGVSYSPPRARNLRGFPCRGAGQLRPCEAHTRACSAVIGRDAASPVLVVAATERELCVVPGASVVCCGIGPVEAGLQTAAALATEACSAILHVGIAGGRDLQPGTVVIGSESIYCDVLDQHATLPVSLTSRPPRCCWMPSAKH